jgi:hypothetical protein
MTGRPELSRLNLATAEKGALPTGVVGARAKVAGPVGRPMPAYHREGRSTE